MDNNLKKKNCTGCKLCGDICPVGAIEYRTDKEGFWHPLIDREKCIRCGRCRRFCPELNVSKQKNACQNTYQAWIKDDKIRLKSTSGGVFYALAVSVLEQKGAVAGCAYTDNYKGAHHCLIEDRDKLDALMGSKYFQSDTAGIYKTVEEHLRTGQKVLFCGSPCQCAAMRNYLNKDYENLFTAEYICLGINSPKAFAAFVSELEKRYRSKVKRVHLKNKNTGWQSLATYVEFENGRTYHADRTEDPWVNGFITEKLYMRPACHECRHRGNERCADITFGDFWGIKGASEADLFKGISAVMVNTDKGRLLFKQAEDMLYVKEKSMEDVVKGNPAYHVSPKLSEHRGEFFDCLPRLGFTKAVRTASGKGGPGVLSGSLGTLMKGLPQIDVSGYLGKARELWNKYKIELPPGMLMKTFVEQVDIAQYVYYNYISGNVERKEGTFLVPYKNAVIDLDATAKIIINKGVLEVGINQFRHSKSPTCIRMGANARWIVNGNVGLFYDTVFEVQKNGLFESQYFTANGGSVIICAKHIKFGKNVMIGRNVIIYDSDHHQILDAEGSVKNPPEDVIIEDDVWLTSNIVVFKGVTIRSGSVVGAYTVINKDIPNNAMAVGGGMARVVNTEMRWSRNSTNHIKR